MFGLGLVRRQRVVGILRHLPVDDLAQRVLAALAVVDVDAEHRRLRRHLGAGGRRDPHRASGSVGEPRPGRRLDTAVEDGRAGAAPVRADGDGRTLSAGRPVAPLRIFAVDAAAEQHGVAGLELAAGDDGVERLLGGGEAHAVVAVGAVLGVGVKGLRAGRRFGHVGDGPVEHRPREGHAARRKLAAPTAGRPAAAVGIARAAAVIAARRPRRCRHQKTENYPTSQHSTFCILHYLCGDSSTNQYGKASALVQERVSRCSRIFDSPNEKSCSPHLAKKASFDKR